MKKQEIFEKIARETMSIETLEERKMDDLDFHDVSVVALRNALEAAYEAGRKSNK